MRISAGDEVAEHTQHRTNPMQQRASSGESSVQLDVSPRQIEQRTRIEAIFGRVARNMESPRMPSSQTPCIGGNAVAQMAFDVRSYHETARLWTRAAENAARFDAELEGSTLERSLAFDELCSNLDAKANKVRTTVAGEAFEPLHWRVGGKKGGKLAITGPGGKEGVDICLYTLSPDGKAIEGMEPYREVKTISGDQDSGEISNASYKAATDAAIKGAKYLTIYGDQNVRRAAFGTQRTDVKHRTIGAQTVYVRPRELGAYRFAEKSELIDDGRMLATIKSQDPREDKNYFSIDAAHSEAAIAGISDDALDINSNAMLVALLPADQETLDEDRRESKRAGKRKQTSDSDEEG